MTAGGFGAGAGVGETHVAGWGGAKAIRCHVHATSVAIGDCAVVLMGAPGAGKSDLAIRLIDRGARLIADDQTIVTRGDGPAGGSGRLVADTPPRLAGLIEVRGVGIMSLPWVSGLGIALAVTLDAAPERLPEASFWTCLGQRVPEIRCPAFEASAPVKIEWALRRLTGASPLADAHSIHFSGEGFCDAPA